MFTFSGPYIFVVSPSRTGNSPMGKKANSIASQPVLLILFTPSYMFKKDVVDEITVLRVCTFCDIFEIAFPVGHGNLHGRKRP